MPSFSPELIRIMRAALDEVMTQIPLEQATPGVKAALAEYILKAAAQGQTSYEDLIAAAAGQIQTILSMLKLKSGNELGPPSGNRGGDSN